MAFLSFTPQRAFSDLSDREVLALAIQNEEEDGRIYRDFAERMRDAYPASAGIFVAMAEEENEHRRRLLELYHRAFRRPHSADPPRGRARLHPPQAGMDDAPQFDVDAMRERAKSMEDEAANFYRRAAGPEQRPRRAQAARRSRGHRGTPCRPGRPSGGRRLQERARRGARDGATGVRAAGGPARPRRTDGRVGVDAGAGVRRRVRHAHRPGRRFWSAWRHRSAPASRWASPRRCPTTAR